MNGRQVSQLYLMAPGAVNSGSGTFDNIRFSGRSNQQNVIRFDGVEGSSIVDSSPGNLNGETTSLFRLEQSLENVQEFRVDSNNYPAEYGTGTGGQISFVTKSRHQRFPRLGVRVCAQRRLRRAQLLRPRHQVQTAPESVRRLASAARSSRTRLFFFASFEGLRQRTSSPFVESTLSAAVRAPDCGAAAMLAPVCSARLPGRPVRIQRSAARYRQRDRSRATSTRTPAACASTTTSAPNSASTRRYFRDQGESSQTQNSTLSQYQHHHRAAERRGQPEPDAGRRPSSTRPSSASTAPRRAWPAFPVRARMPTSTA